MSVKALGIALKLTFEGTNQLVYPETWAFAIVVISCVMMQITYLNKVNFSIQMQPVLGLELCAKVACYQLRVEVLFLKDPVTFRPNLSKEIQKL